MFEMAEGLRGFDRHIRAAAWGSDRWAHGDDARLGGTAAGRGDTAPVVCGWAHRVCFVSRRIVRWEEAAPGWSFFVEGSNSREGNRTVNNRFLTFAQGAGLLGISPPISAEILATLVGLFKCFFAPATIVDSAG